MKYITILAFGLIFLTYSSIATAQKVTAIKFDQLEEILSTERDSPLIINFWATWCGPCVKELPQFESLLEKYKDQNLEIILVSLDFADDLENKVQPFVEKKGLKSKVYVLDELDANSYIDKVDPSWSGAIPATLILQARNDKKLFLEREFKEGELETIYLDFIN